MKSELKFSDRHYVHVLPVRNTVGSAQHYLWNSLAKKKRKTRKREKRKERLKYGQDFRIAIPGRKYKRWKNILTSVHTFS